MYGKLIAASAAAALLQSASVNALPDTTTGNVLNNLGLQTPAGIGNVLQDHENPKTLYVGPANDKEILGTYANTGGGPSCSAYSTKRMQLDRVPLTDELAQQAYERGDFVSNYFQLAFAIPAANGKAIDDIRSKSLEISMLAVQHEGEIDAFKIMEQQWIDLARDKSEAKADIASLEKKEQRDKDFCMLTMRTDPDKGYQCYFDTLDKYRGLYAEADKKVDEVQAKIDAISDTYYEAKGKFDAVDEKIARLTTQFTFLQQLYAAQSMIVNNAYDFEYKAVKEMGDYITGIASAGYNLWGNEAAILSNTLLQAGRTDYSVTQLNVFDIRMQANVTRDNPNITTDDNHPIFRKNVWSYPRDSFINKRNLKDEWAMPFEREEFGDTIHYDVTGPQAYGSGGVDFHVTTAARCGDIVEDVSRDYTYRRADGTTSSWTVTRDEYRPTLNQPVFATTIALSYSYYAYPGKIKGECSIEVDRMNSYWRNAGKSKGWSWFRSKTKSWDHIRTSALEELGMECNLSVVPEAPDPQEAKRLADKFEAEMYSEMWKMFLAVYAESYDLVVKDPEVPDAGESDVGATLGDGIKKVCPANAVCHFANVVLRTLDKIGGSKAQGTTSYNADEYGKIWRRFEKDSFNVYQGTASIKAKVCLDPTRCN
ncbi:hypothetical protein BB427_03260 [Pseudoalteromonas sp. BMB]|uniref:hypothetical protein n=1 Tax=Pseudoalteromonas sp. BMB TaxID=1874619 RepID=UPI00083DE5EE|nr:hypothetical protein [Pseudoalteromonas sp. BMB]ODB35632.1 hypothetical protein BB427_03260 [Pseudoalteromonas sp. BMB]